MQYLMRSQSFYWFIPTLLSGSVLLAACSENHNATPALQSQLTATITRPETSTNFAVPQEVFGLPNLSEYLNTGFQMPYNLVNDLGISDPHDLFARSNQANAYGLANTNLLPATLPIPHSKQAEDEVWRLINAYPVPNDVLVVVEVMKKNQKKQFYSWSLRQSDNHGHFIKNPNSTTFQEIGDFLEWDKLHSSLTTGSRAFNQIQTEFFKTIQTQNLTLESSKSAIVTYQTKLEALLNWSMLQFVLHANNQQVYRIKLEYDSHLDQKDQGVVGFHLKFLNIAKKVIFTTETWSITANGFAHSASLFSLQLKKNLDTQHKH